MSRVSSRAPVRPVIRPVMRQSVRSAYGPWLLIAVALLAVPAMVPAGDAARLCRISAVDAGAVRGLLAVERASASGRVDVRRDRDVRAEGATVRVEMARPADAIGLHRIVLPPPSLA
jgi:hypothetical protein